MSTTSLEHTVLARIIHKPGADYTRSDLDRLANARVAICGRHPGANSLAELGIGTGSQGWVRTADLGAISTDHAGHDSESAYSAKLNALIEDGELVIDTVDQSRLDVKLALHATARAKNIPVVMTLCAERSAIGYLFTPDSLTFEEFFAFPQHKAIRPNWVLPPSRILSPIIACGESTHRCKPAWRCSFEENAGQRPRVKDSVSLRALGIVIEHLMIDVLLGRPIPNVPAVLFVDPGTVNVRCADLRNAVVQQQESIWTRIAPVYDKALVPSGGKTVYGEVMDLFADDLAGCARILEAGVGTGVIAEKLALGGAEVYGIDLNLGMLAYALRRADRLRAGGCGRMYVGEGNVEHLFFQNEWFDGYCSNNVVFDADIHRALREAWRVLKPGGKLAVHSIGTPLDLDRLGTADHLISLGVEPEAAREFLRCQEEIRQGRSLNYGRVNNFDTDYVTNLLRSIGFREILRTEKTYRGFNFYIVARK